MDQSVLSTEVIKEPVNKKVVEGTKKATSSTKYITGSGQFIWPVPNYRYCSRWYGGRHKGVDICAPAGTPIYASAGGTVTKAGYNKAGAGTGYGYSVIISHGGGYSSVYAPVSYTHLDVYKRQGRPERAGRHFSLNRQKKKDCVSSPFSFAILFTLHHFQRWKRRRCRSRTRCV